MFAKTLEQLLERYFEKSELGQEPDGSFARRFESLRRCNLLPVGRKRRAQRLGLREIATAILGSVAVQPAWAGFTAIGLAKLVPVGGSARLPIEALTLLDAIIGLLSNEKFREQMVALTLSSAEGGVNIHHYGRLIFSDGSGSLSVASFVSPMALSLAHNGADSGFDHFRPFARVSRETTFDIHFFRSLAIEIESAALWPTSPPGDGREYDTEDAEAERRARIGVRANSRYLNVGVDTHVVWPPKERLIKFGEYELVLMPPTKENCTSIHIDLAKWRITDAQGLTVINRFLSMVAWVDDHFAIAQDGWSGNPIPVPVHKRQLAFVTSHGWYFDRHPPASTMALTALALYREARNAEENFLISYAVLNYYKILELQHPQGRETRKWIASHISEVQDKLSDSIVARFKDACGALPAEKYIYDACRLAVAHASEKSPSDPDLADEQTRLHVAAEMLRPLSRCAMREMGLTDQRHEPDEG